MICILTFRPLDHLFRLKFCHLLIQRSIFVINKHFFYVSFLSHHFLRQNHRLNLFTTKWRLSCFFLLVYRYYHVFKFNRLDHWFIKWGTISSFNIANYSRCVDESSHLWTFYYTYVTLQCNNKIFFIPLVKRKTNQQTKLIPINIIRNINKLHILPTPFILPFRSVTSL